MGNHKWNEPNLLEICLAMGKNGVPLGGSPRFHQRVVQSLHQDNSVYDMLDYAKSSGRLLKRPTRQMSRKLTSQGVRRRKGVMSLDDIDVKSATRRELPPLLKSSTPPGHRQRHSSFCDVLGPDACEQCRKNKKQTRFVRNARTRVTRSLPDIDRLLAVATGPGNAPEPLLPSRKQPKMDAVNHHVAFMDNPIAEVSRAQWRPHADTTHTAMTSKYSSLGKHQGTSNVGFIRQGTPHGTSRRHKAVPRISHSELHRRVMDQHREKQTQTNTER